MTIQDKAFQLMSSSRGELIRNGRVYGAFIDSSDVDVGGALDFILSIGSRPAAVLGLNIIANTTEVSFSISRDPTYTGGSPVPKLNFNDIVGVTGEENVTPINSTVSVTDIGDIVFGPWTLYSSNNTTITRNLTGPLVLRADTSYLIRVLNPAVNNVEISLSLEYIDK